MGALTCLTGEADCWRPLETRDVGDLEVGFGGTRGGVLCAIIMPPSTCISIMVVWLEAWKLEAWKVEDWKLVSTV